jgi:hypothetical protein
LLKNTFWVVLLEHAEPNERFRDDESPAEEAETGGDFNEAEDLMAVRLKEVLADYLRSWPISPIFSKEGLDPGAAIAILIVISTSFLLKKAPFYPDPSVVEYVESQAYNVMVYESEKPKVTVIWLFEGPEEGASSI